MAQFDAVMLRSGELVVVLQSDLVDHLPTRLVAPLVPIDSAPSIVARLNPPISVNGTDYILATHLAAAVPVGQLGRVETMLREDEYAIRAAIDMLVIGF
jgi:toxin CcdB